MDLVGKGQGVVAQRSAGVGGGGRGDQLDIENNRRLATENATKTEKRVTNIKTVQRKWKSYEEGRLGERGGGGGCAGVVLGTIESVEVDVERFVARSVGASSACGYCWRAKYREISSSGIFLRGSQVGSYSPAD